MNLPVVILIVATIANAALAALVFFKKPKGGVNRLFALTALATAGWTSTNALFQATNSVAVAMTAAQMSSAISLLMSASFLHFSWIYPIRQPSQQLRLRVLWVSTLLLVLLSLWPGAVDHAVEIADVRKIITGPAFYLVALFFLTTVGAAFRGFGRNTVTLHGTMRDQALYVLAGAGVTAFCGIVFNVAFPLWGDYRLVWLGPACSVFFVVGTVVSIIAHHLFDIRLIVKRTVVYSVLLAIIGAGYSGIEYVLTQALEAFSQSPTSSLAAHIFGALVVGLCFGPLRKWLERRVHHLLYPRR